ncbi:hypothetical protein C8J56DRAFT_896384 [Mycena floridula]|nr:hypothetical protein C8J56DRAFT_896384 [Mycena floridula]
MDVDMEATQVGDNENELEHSPGYCNSPQEIVWDEIVKVDDVPVTPVRPKPKRQYPKKKPSFFANSFSSQDLKSSKIKGLSPVIFATSDVLNLLELLALTQLTIIPISIALPPFALFPELLMYDVVVSSHNKNPQKIDPQQGASGQRGALGTISFEVGVALPNGHLGSWRRPWTRSVLMSAGPLPVTPRPLHYEAHLWARLLGASDFVGTAIKVPNGDIHVTLASWPRRPNFLDHCNSPGSLVLPPASWTKKKDIKSWSDEPKTASTLKTGTLRRDALTRLIALTNSDSSSLKIVAADNIQRFFSHFPDLESAINATTFVQIQDYGAITQLSKMEKRWVKRNPDVLLQLLQSDKEAEVKVVKKALVITRANAESIDDEDAALADRLRSLVIAFMTNEARRAIIRRAGATPESASETMLITGIQWAIPSLDDS